MAPPAGTSRRTRTPECVLSSSSHSPCFEMCLDGHAKLAGEIALDGGAFRAIDVQHEETGVSVAPFNRHEELGAIGVPICREHSRYAQAGIDLPCESTSELRQFA
jgi:hypothetical protein